MRIVFLIALSLVSSLALGEAPKNLVQFQMQVSDAIKASKEGSKSELALDAIRQKFISVGGQSAWRLDPQPTPAQITSSKPRIRVNNALDSGTRSHVPRWEIFQKQNASGVCDSLSISEFRTESSLAATDCPTATPSPKSFEVDSTALASLELNPALGQDQRGFIAIPNQDKLSDSDKNRLFSGTAFSLPSASLEAVPIKFLAYVPDNAANPQSVIAIKVQAGNIVANVPLPPPPPTLPSEPCGTFTACTGDAATCMNQVNSGVAISGGRTSKVGLDTVLTFTSSGTLNVTQEGRVLILLVGGGAGGNSAFNCQNQCLVGNGWGSPWGGAGGGGGGEVLYGFYQLCKGTVNISVGAGGRGGLTAPTPGCYATCPFPASALDGTDSSIGSLKALPGRAPLITYDGGMSGSLKKGGVGGYEHMIGGGRTNQMFPMNTGGGGGGAGTIGGNRINRGTDGLAFNAEGGGGNGGNGVASDISGTRVWYGGGGGGGWFEKGGQGGLGGGGNGAGSYSELPATSGVPNSGGGGGGGRVAFGGGRNLPSGAGGSGIVIIRYKP